MCTARMSDPIRRAASAEGNVNVEVPTPALTSDKHGPQTTDDAPAPVPPDGGWGWVIVAASALAFFITGGFARSFTLVYHQLIIKFDASASSTAFVAALFGAVKLCSSPVVGGMCNKFGFQKVVIAGGLVSSLGMALSSFPSSLTHLYLSYGVITAFGTNMVITPSFVILGQYFRNRKAMAMSLATIGACFGGVAFPPLIERLFRLYGYSGTMLIVAGVMLNYCVAGALFRPIKPSAAVAAAAAVVVVHDAESAASESEKSSSNSNGGKPVASESSRAVRDAPLATEYNAQAEKRYSPIFIAARRDDQYSSCTALVEQQSTCVVLLYHDAVPTTTKVCVAADDGGAERPASRSCVAAVRGHLRAAFGAVSRYLGLPLLRNTHLSVFIVLMVGSFICMGTSNTFLSELADQVGISSTQVATMLAVSSGVNIPSRFFSGLIFDRPLVRRYRQPIFAVVGLVIAVFAAAMPLSRGVVALSACCIGHCFFGSSFHSQHVTVLSDIVGRRNLASAMGLCRFFQGIGVVVGPMVGGMLKDYTGEYSYAFYMGGVVLLLCTIVFQVFYFTQVSKPLPDDTESEAAPK